MGLFAENPCIPVHYLYLKFYDGDHMLAKRIIPCLDIRNGRVVKGVNFINIKDAGDPVEIAEEYNKQNADELVFLDITASFEGRKCMLDIIRRTAEKTFIPVCVGGGIADIDDYRQILRAGADKVSVNSAAIKNNDLISDAARVFGSQCVVVAIDGKKIDNDYYVYINGGRLNTGIKVLDWARKVERLGAGEILFTSMNTDGTKNGFDIEITSALSSIVSIPVIASGGCGKLEHFAEVFSKTGASGALAASVFHYGELSVHDVKSYLTQNNIPVRR